MLALLFLAGFVAFPQQVPGTRPAAADSAWARELLEVAEAEVTALPSGVSRTTVGRLGRAWAEWGERARGEGLLGSASADDPVGPFALLQQDLYHDSIVLGVGRYLSGDTAAARRVEAALTDEGREALRAELVTAHLRSGRLSEADSLLALIDGPLARARAILHGTVSPGSSGLTTDRVIAWLSEELERMEGRSDGEVADARLYIHGRLLDLGVTLTPAAVSAWLTPPQAQRNLQSLAEQLQRSGRAEDAATFLDSALALAETRSDMRQVESTATVTPPRPTELRSLLSSAWPLGAGLDPAPRDSARLGLIRPWLALGSEEALPKALEIETPRYREQAIASLVTSLDVERVAALVAGFTDEEASNRAFSHLTMQYLHAGQVSQAEAAAERTVSGEPRVWAFARVADARWNAGDTTAARALILRAIAELGDEATCEVHCEVVVSTEQAAPPMTPMTTSPSLLVPVIALSYLAGEREALEAWARTRSDADARARALVAITEVVHRLHGRTGYERIPWGVWGR